MPSNYTSDARESLRELYLASVVNESIDSSVAKQHITAVANALDRFDALAESVNSMIDAVKGKS